MLTGNCKHCKNTLDLKTQYKIATCFCFCTFEILWTPWIPTRIRTNFVRWLRSLHCSVLIKHPTSLKTSASYATAGKLLTNKLGLLMSPVRRNTGRTHGQINLSGVNAQARAGTLDRTVFFLAKAESTPEHTSIFRNDVPEWLKCLECIISRRTR